MSRKTDNVFLDRALEASEHRKGDDERRHSKSNSDDGDEGNKRNESAVTAGAKVTKRYEERYWHSTGDLRQKDPSLLLGPIFEEITSDEGVYAAVHDPVNVAGFDIRPMVLYERVRLEYIRPDLASPLNFLF